MVRTKQVIREDAVKLQYAREVEKGMKYTYEEYLKAVEKFYEVIYGE